jgi:signal transduction histidine kinase
MAKKKSSAAEPLEELAEQTALADAGEAAGVFLHELGNVLNNLLLSNRLMQRQLPEEFRTRLADSCRLITEVAGQMQQVAKFRQTRRQEVYSLDLNKLVKEVVDDLGVKPAKLTLELAETPPPITATAADSKRVLRFLIQNALAVTDKKKPVLLRTATETDQVVMVLEDSGGPLSEEQMRHFFSPFQNLRPGQNNLELAICKNLMRRMGGQLETEIIPEEGVRFRASWPTAKKS